ncbi:MAG: VWA domain-containing protein [Planctomycetes bacterium]|nr:VWA domain-containing protein [Planctomycetota bacterium]
MARNGATLTEDSGLHQDRRSRGPLPGDDVAPLDEDLVEEAGDEEDGVSPRRRGSVLNSGFFQSFGSVFVSMAVHLAVLITLALLMVDQPTKEKLQTIVAEMFEEPDEEFVEVELDQQIEAVTEQAVSVVSAAPTMGALGTASAAAASMQVDQSVAERAEVSDVAITGLNVLAPPSERIIEEVPEGFLGDPRAIVDDYDEAMDRITQEILNNLQKSNVLLVWCFDQSNSMKDDQREIRDRIYRVYEELGLVNAANSDALTTAVVSYGQGYILHTKPPTNEVNKIKFAIEQVPVDESGLENMCTAVGRAITDHRSYCMRTQRRMMLVLVTDESGEHEDNAAYVEAAIEAAKAARCKIYTLGREAVFGYPYAFMRWRHPQTNHIHWLRINRGPETAFVEQLQTNGFRRRHDAFPSGFGPYEQCRMARETGGIYFMLPSLESNLVRGEKRRYELDIMRPYRVDLRSRAECFFDRDKSKLQTTLWDIIYTLDPYNPQAAKYIELRVEFSPEYPTFVKQVDHELKKLPLYLTALAAASDTVEKLLYEREQETDPRWQANYDLMRAHLVAYQARVYEYGSYLQAFVQKPEVAPLTKGKAVLVHWDITTRKETMTEESKPYIERSIALYETVIQNHAGTPWAGVAQKEIKRGFGVKLVPDYHVPYKHTGTEPLMPIPKY